MAHTTKHFRIPHRALALSMLFIAAAIWSWQSASAHAQPKPRSVPMSKALVAAKVLGVCSGPAVALSLSPGTITIPTATNGGACTSAPFTLTNLGSVPVSVGSIFTSFSSGCDESSPLSTSGCANSSLGAESSCTGSVNLCPSSNCTGPRTGLLSVNNVTVGTTLTANLSFSIVDPAPTPKPEIFVNNTSLDFGNVLQGLTSTQQSITVTNTGNAPLTVNATPPVGTAFAITGDTCTGTPVPGPTGSCVIHLTYTASTPANGFESDTLTLTHNDPNPASFQFSPVNISLQGNGVAPPGLVLGSAFFGTVDYGSVWSTSVSFTNANASSVRPIGVSVVETTTPFTLGADTCTAQLIPAGGTCTVDVIYTAPAAGTTNLVTTHTLSMNVDTTPLATPTIVNLTSTLDAEAIPPAPTINITPSVDDGFGNLTFTFPNSVVGVPTGCQAFTYTNAGPSTAVFLNSDPSNPFLACPPPVGGPPACASLVDGNGNIVLGSGGSCLVAYLFSPISGFQAQDFGLGPYDPFRGSVYINRLGLLGTGTGAIIDFNPSSLAFGSQVINTTSAPQVVTVSNTGTLPLTIFSMTPPTDTTFTVAADACAPYPRILAAGGGCTVTFQFVPGAAIATHFSSAVFNSNTVLSFSPTSNSFFSMDGEGVAVPTPSADFFPMSLSFGNVPYNTTAAARSFSFANTGSAPMTISGIAVTGTNAGDFLVTHNCPLSPATLGINTCCTVNVQFRPTQGGAGPVPETASVDITTNATPAVSSVPVDGVSIPPPSITATPLSVNFPDTVVGASSVPTKIVLQNTGTTAIILGNFSISGDFAQAPLGPIIPPATFATPTSTCNPGPMAIGASCYIEVVFKPNSLGALAGALSLPFTNGVASPAVVPLSGNGVSPNAPGIGVSTDLVDFGSVLINQGATRLVTVSSIGNGPLTVTGVRTLQPFFSASTDCGAGIPPGVSCTVTVRCLPDSLTTQTGDLYIDHNATGNFRHIDLKCTGAPLPIPKIEVSVTGVGFGNQSLGTPSATQRVTIRSVGTAGLSLRNIGTLLPFAIQHACPLVLPVGESCVVNVFFSPAGSGPNIGQLAIASDDPARPSVLVELNGIGCRPYSVQAGRRGGSLCSP